MYQNATKKIKLFKVGKKVKWKIANKKIVSIKQKKGKYKNIIVIKAKKCGKTSILAKVGKKKYKLKVTVLKKSTDDKKDIQNNEKADTSNDRKIIDTGKG